MKNILLLSLVLLTGLNLSAQNQYRFSQFNFVKSLYNPGALAIDANFTADLIYRNQWAGVDGAPSTIGFNSAYQLSDVMAVGVNFYNDRIGLNQTNAFSLMYAYRLIIEDQRYVAFGLGVGMDNNAFGMATTTTANDPAFSQAYSTFKFNAAFGCYYRSPIFYAGFSIPQIFQNTSSGPDAGFSLGRFQYVVVTGYNWVFSERFTLNPNIQVKATMYAPIQGDFVLRGIMGDFGLSLGYRSENSLIAGMDYTFAGRVRLGYSFNYDVGSLARTKGMSHEVYLGLGLPYYSYTDKFDKSRYVGRKGGYKRDYKRNFKKRNKRS